VRPVDIVIPIYNARELTRRCIESVRRHATGDWRLVLIDDASPDPDMEPDLRAIAAEESRILLLFNEHNRGFTGTANKGMQQRGDRDVLLLNSDTEVYAGFLDRLRADAYCDEATGIVGPLSNNATHCSIPIWMRDNPLPPGYTGDELAALVGRASRRELPEMVTAVGFCMYIRAEVFDDIGYFDEETFGRGYCEEIDFCERAKRMGWKVRLADDVFVLHVGKASFGDEGRQRQTDNFRLLEPKHPNHVRDYSRMIEENPFEPLQRELRFAIDRARRSGEAAVLHLCAGPDFVPPPGARTLVAWPGERGPIVAERFGDERLEYAFPLNNPAPELCVRHAELEVVMRAWPALFGATAVHLHKLAHWPLQGLPTLGAPLFVDEEALTDLRLAKTTLTKAEMAALRTRETRALGRLCKSATVVSRAMSAAELARAYPTVPPEAELSGERLQELAERFVGAR
jgi:GT2 family glycosyltransferase